jgi:molecular chaperone DnaJ
MLNSKKPIGQKQKNYTQIEMRTKKNAEEDFKAVNEAYEVLKDPNKKAAYDRYGHAAFESGGGFGQTAGQGDFGSAFSDVFEDLFGDFMGNGNGGRRNSQRAARGSDLRYNMRVTLEEAFSGKKSNITLPSSVSCATCSGSGAQGGAQPLTCPTCSGQGKVRAQQGFFTVERACPTCTGKGQIIKNPCKECRGQGRVEKQRALNVTIPAGVETGQRIRLTGEGEAGLQNGPSGDLYIFIEVADHQLFDREGSNLLCRIPISMTIAALGGEIEAPTVDGGKCKVKVPHGVQSGKQLRLKGKGMPPIRGGGFGDLYIDLTVETPVNLSSEQKELLRKFEKSGKDNHPAGKDFISIVKKFWEKGKN